MSVDPDSKIEAHTPKTSSKKLLIELGIVVGVGLVLLLVMPAIFNATGQGFRINLLGRFMALSIAALAIDLIWGFTGLLSLGHGVFFTLGGYALGMHLKLQFPPEATVKLPAFMPLYGVNELPAFWQPFFNELFVFGNGELSIFLIAIYGCGNYGNSCNYWRTIGLSVFPQSDSRCVFFDFDPSGNYRIF